MRTTSFLWWRSDSAFLTMRHPISPAVLIMLLAPGSDQYTANHTSFMVMSLEAHSYHGLRPLDHSIR